MQGTRRATMAVPFAVAMTAVAVPVVTHPLPPLTDYVNNLAAAYVIGAIGADADLQRYYAIEWRIVPNLMMDLVVPALHRFMSIYLAGQVFVVLALGLILSGTFALSRALLGRWSVAPAAAAVILYNEVLLVGVMNYVFGVGLALWALAGWVALRARPWPWRIAVSTLFVVALFVCHLFAVGLYGLGVLALETHRLWATRTRPLAPRLVDFVGSGVPFLAAALLMLASPTLELAGEVRWEVRGKFEGLQLVVTVYDYAIGALVAAGFALALAWSMRRGVLRLHPMGWMLLIIGGAIYLAMPRVLFATHLADQRLPVALAFMLIACLDIDLRERPLRRGLAVLFAGLLAVRLAEVQIGWNELGRQSETFRRSVLELTRGARVLTVFADRDAYGAGRVSDFNLVHAASLAIIERAALVSSAFVVPGKHVLQVRAPYRRFVNRDDRVPPSADWLRPAAGSKDETDRFYWSQWHLHYDYVYVLFADPGRANPDAAHLTLVREGPGFQLYRVILKR